MPGGDTFALVMGILSAGNLLRLLLVLIGLFIVLAEMSEGRWRWSLRYLLALLALVVPPTWLFMHYGPSSNAATLARLPGLILFTWQMVLVVFAMLLGTAGRSAGAPVPSNREEGLRLLAGAVVLIFFVVLAHVLSNRSNSSIAYPVATWLSVLASASLARRIVGPRPEMRARRNQQ